MGERSDYLSKVFPSTEPEKEIAKQAEAYAPEIKEHIEVFKNYFTTRAEAMGMDAGEAAEKQKVFLANLFEYCANSGLRMLIDKEANTNARNGSEAGENLINYSDIILQSNLSDILKQLGLKDTTEIEDVRPIETQGHKGMYKVTNEIPRTLPHEIFEEFAKMRNEINDGVQVLGDVFFNKYREIYKQNIE